jgi:hypothetical protein
MTIQTNGDDKILVEASRTAKAKVVAKDGESSKKATAAHRRRWYWLPANAKPCLPRDGRDWLRASRIKWRRECGEESFLWLSFFFFWISPAIMHICWLVAGAQRDAQGSDFLYAEKYLELSHLWLPSLE